MKVAAVQLASTPGVEDNRERCARYIAEAAGSGARLVVLPEASQRAFGAPGQELAPDAESLDGPFVEMLLSEAARHDLVVVAGMFERSESGLPLNTTVVAGPGGLLGAYRKIHLYDAFSFVESDGITAGPVAPSNIVVVEVDGWRVGVQTCFDIRFPEMSRALVDAGAEVFVMGAAWVVGSLKASQFVHLVAARAIESTCYLVAAGQPRPRFCGISRILDPTGVVLASTGPEGEIVLTAELSRESMAATRASMPVLEARRLRLEQW